MPIQWEEPPALEKGPVRKYVDFFNVLRANPGRWALWPGPANATTASAIKQGAYGGIAAGEFEAVTRDSRTASLRVYVRYAANGTTP